LQEITLLLAGCFIFDETASVGEVHSSLGKDQRHRDSYTMEYDGCSRVYHCHYVKRLWYWWLHMGTCIDFQYNLFSCAEIRVPLLHCQIEMMLHKLVIIMYINSLIL
jgi:hypothetical protein